MSTPTVSHYDRAAILAAGYVSLGSLGSSMMTLARHTRLARETDTPYEGVTAFRVSALGEWEAFAKADKLGAGFRDVAILPPSR